PRRRRPARRPTAAPARDSSSPSTPGRSGRALRTRCDGATGRATAPSRSGSRRPCAPSRSRSKVPAMVNVLVTTAFDETRLDRLRRISPDLTVTRAEADTADYSRAEILYAGALPHDPGRAPGLKWVQVHMAGVNGLYEHPIYANRAIALTTASGVHAATVAEYAITALLALAHRVPRMVEWHGRGTWPPDEQRWPVFVPTAVRGAMKKTAYFINVGRGASVDERALAATLVEKRIAGAAVDVFAQEPPAPGHPLYAADNVILSPHVSGFVASYDDDCCTLFAENLRRYLAGAPLLNLVDRAKGY